MPQVTGQTVLNTTGAVFRSALNGILGALFSSNSGTTAPSTTVAGQLWFDTTTGALKIRNAANTAWVTLGANFGVLADALAGTSTTLAINPDVLKDVLDGVSGAPIAQVGWHPYDRTSYGGAGTGLVYDSGVNGSVASITLPDFADGYEYRIIGDELTLSTGDKVEMDLYRETNAAYAGYQTLASHVSGTQVAVFDVEIAPRIVRQAHTLIGIGGPQNTGSSSTSGTSARAVTWHHTPAQKILRARIRNDTRNITTGKVWLYRRLLP